MCYGQLLLLVVLKYYCKHTVFDSNCEVCKRKVEQQQNKVEYDFSKKDT